MCPSVPRGRREGRHSDSDQSQIGVRGLLLKESRDKKELPSAKRHAKRTKKPYGLLDAVPKPIGLKYGAGLEEIARLYIHCGAVRRET